MKTGIIKFFNKEKGFGFIVPDPIAGGGLPSDVFVHITGINGAAKDINKGDKVEYNEFNGKKGIQAKDLNVIIQTNK